MLGVSTNYQDRQNWADKGPEANDLKQGQLHSRPDMNINAPEPTPRPSIQEPDTTGMTRFRHSPTENVTMYTFTDPLINCLFMI